MSQITDQIDHFREFALARLNASERKLTIDDLYDEWRTMNPDPTLVEADQKAIAASLQDYRQGISGKPAAEVIRRLNSQLPNK